MSGSHGHHHHHHHVGHERKLGFACLIIATFVGVEVVGGWLANSLALLADAGHMALDAAALALAWWAARLSRRQHDDRLTYGYHRSQVLAAFVNALALVVLSCWILIEAFGRLQAPEPVLPVPALVVAAIGFAINVIAFRTLHGHDNLNVRGAALHVLGDLLGSVAAMTSAALIWAFGWYLADPLLALFIVAILIRGAWLVLRESTMILLEGTPRGIDLDELKNAVAAQVTGVVGVHHVHAWALTDDKPLLTLHAQVGDRVDAYGVVRNIKAVLLEQFGIEHSTVQIELDDCPDDASSNA